MSFVLNDTNQMSLFDFLAFLPERKQRILEKSWAKKFSDHIFTQIDEMIFAPLYSEKSNSRPNAPVNVIVGALILKEFNGLTDDEMLEEVECDFRYQYALHTMSYDTQPISDRTFSRFRERVAAYELTTGIDLIHKCVTSLAENLREFMDIEPNIKRMDSMMIESNIRRMGRLELLYTCLSNLVKLIHRDGRVEILEGLEEYADPDNRNRVIYHNNETSQTERIQKIIDDASKLLPLCKEDYANTADYQLLVRALNEQTKDDGTGKKIAKDKKDGINSSVLQNPSDPEATYREKAGKKHRGYVGNFTETVGENGSVVTDYQYDVNTHSDAAFIRETIDQAEASAKSTVIITDGAYNSEGIRELASQKNITVLSTGMSGLKPREILGQFQISDDYRKVISCPAGYAPKSCCYLKKWDNLRISLQYDCCDGCPHQAECNPKMKKSVAVVLIPLKSWRRLRENRTVDEATRIRIGRIRNGVETVPSVIRNKYRVDKMPVRGKLKTKQFFGFKIAALNFSKLIRFLDGKEKCRALCQG